MKLPTIAFAVHFSVLSFISSPAVGEEPTPERSTHARFVSERADDFAWENDLIAFRAYGPALRSKPEDSGFDAWLKRVPYPIVDKWYAESKAGKSYHEDHGEGYDPYKVGSSRGCGGVALWLDGEMVGSDVFTDWKIVKSAREETVFLLLYEWQHGGDTYTEAKEITIRLGERLFRSNSTFKKNGKLAANLPIAIGLVRHNENDKVVKDRKQGWMAVWETIDGSDLGTGVVIHPAKIDSFLVKAGPGDLDDHAIFLTRTDANGRVVYFAGYGWQRAGEITTLEKWTDYLSEFSKNQKNL